MTVTRLLMAIVAVAGFCGACTQAPDRVTFCESRDGIPFFSRAFTLDPVNLRFEAYDVGSAIRIVRTQRFRGIIEPFPMMVPTKEVAQAGLPVAWIMGDYRFVASGTADPDRIKVRAELRDGSVVRPGTRVHTLDYSYRTGVLADTAEGEIGGEKFTDVFYPCLGEKLDLLAIKADSSKSTLAD